MIGKKAISPLIATFLLILFAISLGTVVMSIGQSYLTEQPLQDEDIVCYNKNVGDPLKQLQIRYLNNEITKEEYLNLEKEILD